MTKEELIERLDDIEWEDFEVKSARNELPKNNTLRSGSKMNHPILPVSKKYSIDGKTVLAFYISSSPFKPVWFNSIQTRSSAQVQETDAQLRWNSEITYSTVTYYLKRSGNMGQGGMVATDKTTDKTGTKTGTNIRDLIIRSIRSNPSIMVEELAQICKLSGDGTRYHIKQLKKDGILLRVGKKGGHWEILK